ncbi:hypothetical protein BTJ40_05330 [Microbulbifer sp. A4B17]|uniref:hypothetical protein n=1 Tax=Microbulbifer sp. A4B17 TaxID=359370 RepID=UPI000D52C130|nr:hypothetical protein [Microbulbifer sp. A4B17]AWF80278.1 hypothetical protein BTJ40_05330 [Microbulbifer sp. A4B17]
MKIMKRVGLCAGVALAVAYQSASAAELTGACYDYASREPTSAVKLDAQAIGMVVAHNVINQSLGASGIPILKNLYPIVYGSITGGFVTETTDGADPQLVGCLQQFNNRISDLESSLIEIYLVELNDILSDAKREIIDLGNLYYHDDAADDYQGLAVKVGKVIRDTLESPVISKAKYDSLVNNVAPAYVSIIQMELLHRTEFNRFCFNQEVYPTWNHIDSDELVDPELLETIKYNDSVFIDSYLTTPEGSVANCNADYNTFLSFDRFIGDEFDSYKVVLGLLGISVTESEKMPGMVSVSLDINNSELGAYREQMLGECSDDGEYTDSYYNRTRDAGSKSDCFGDRRDYLRNEIRFSGIYSENSGRNAEARRNLIFHNLAAVVDSWDWYSHVSPEAVAQLDEDTMRHGKLVTVPTYSGVRLKHLDTDLCVGSDKKAQHTCDISKNLFMFRPFEDGFNITRISDNNNFKDKGEDSVGFVIRSGEGLDSKWILEREADFGLDAYPNFVNASTGRCLALDDNASLTAVNCDEIDNDFWEIDGVDIPDTHSFVSMRHTGEGKCISKAGTPVSCDIDSVFYAILPQNGGYAVHGSGGYMADTEDAGIAFILATGDSVTWDFSDFNSDGVFRLQNRDTGQCLDYQSGSLVGVDCSLDPAVSELFAFDIVDLPNSSNAERINLKDSTSKHGRCMGKRFTANSGTGQTAYFNWPCDRRDMALVKYNGGYMIYDITNDKYIEDSNDTNVRKYEQLVPSSVPSDSTTWDFLGPYNYSGVNYFSIKNRATGECLKTVELSSYKGVGALSKGDCSDTAASRIWTLPDIGE